MAQAQPATAAASAALEDKPQTIDVDIGSMLQRIDSWIDVAVRSLPNLAVALVVIAVFYGIGIAAERLIDRNLARASRENLGRVLSGFVRWMLVLTGVMLAATVLLPTLKPGDLIAGLGVSSVAIGFAFKDILQNWLAGLLILLRQPFEIGDQIHVEGYEGTVERIETRATIIKTYDGQRVVVPNSDIYTNAVLVKTAHEKRRSEYEVGIGYGDGIDDALRIVRDAVASVDAVHADPAPEALVSDLAASWVTIKARWWTDSRRTDVVHTHSEVLIAIKKALDDAGIDMPYPTQVQLLHDQTDETDGDRDAQREGWPASKDGASPRPRWRVQAERRERERTGDRDRTGDAPAG